MHTRSICNSGPESLRTQIPYHSHHPLFWHTHTFKFLFYLHIQIILSIYIPLVSIISFKNCTDRS
ncbi:hypothetical protein BCR42DRAFT_408038 [Absidia repens]|uniref:Uncharacterized protein n=1 Tax=Absidia repens TaxID=90262 RepID=A0A1X2ISZ8_9FUNG|nr:hypothetical protein BCR42DRAFT_408038 [Absidia repens]